MQAEPIQRNLLVSLLRVEGVPLIAFLGLILTFAGVILLFIARKSTVLCGFGLVSLLPMMIGLTGMLSAHREFTRMAISPMSPKPSELAESILQMAGSGIFGICCSLVPISLAFIGILIQRRQPEQSLTRFPVV